MTNKKKPKVYLTRRLPDVVETRMRELFDAELNIEDTPRSQPELVAAVRTHDVLVPTVTDRIDAKILAQAGPRLKLIASFGTGVDHIDLKTARQRGIEGIEGLFGRLLFGNPSTGPAHRQLVHRRPQRAHGLLQLARRPLDRGERTGDVRRCRAGRGRHQRDARVSR